MNLVGKFNSNIAKYRFEARKCCIRITPYENSDVDSLDDIDLRRIYISISTFDQGWDGLEFAYYVSSPLIRLRIDNKKFQVFKNYREVFDKGLKWKYLDFFEKIGFKQDKFCFPQDYNEYLENETLYNYEQAVRLDKINEYLSGVGIFKECVSDRRILYCGDYDDYIHSITDVVYMRHLSENRQWLAVKHQDYDSPTTFVITAMDQVEKYICALKPLPEPVYIPGDGIGIGSYVCKMLGKKYVSSEPYSIGREAILVGLITSGRFYREEDALLCKSVFFGNLSAFVSPNYKNLRNIKICLWDEQPDLRDIEWYNGGDSRLWYSYPVIPVVPEMKIKYVRALINLGKKFNIIPVDNITKAIYKKYKIKSNDKCKELKVGAYPRSGENMYCFTTRAFTYDIKHGRRGQMKDLGDMIEWVPDKILLDGYVGPVGMSEYDNNVLKVFEFDGTTIIAKEPNYRRIRYVKLGNEKHRISLVGYDEINKLARFMLNSEYCYRKDDN